MKLDLAVNERNVVNNASRIYEISKILTKIERQNEDLRQEINYLKEVSEPLHVHTKQAAEFENVDVEQQQTEQQQPPPVLNRDLCQQAQQSTRQTPRQTNSNNIEVTNYCSPKQHNVESKNRCRSAAQSTT